VFNRAASETNTFASNERSLSHMNPRLSTLAMLAVRLRLHRLAPVTLVGVALLGATTVSALAASATPTPLPTLPSVPPTTLPACLSVAGGTTVLTLVPDANGQPALPCTPQPGQQLVIVGGGNTPDLQATPPNVQTISSVKPDASVTPAATGANAQPADDRLGTMLDPRVDTYAKRQAIRDKYRGLINETTFNDELGDGVSLDQALADAMAELAKAH
jgi:hypothetical protein